ncbi:MAG: DNA-binding protein [Gammaproteobacteria bacterium]|nr:DNA-binding protein [Gammaproteobacteria bacterium]
MEKLLSTKEAADRLGLASGTLENWRLSGKGPPWHKPVGKIYYLESELLEWVKNEK